MALENAAEGGVRETWGALAAAWQALHAEHLEARAVFRRIAEEEAEHAELSRAVDQWLQSRLSAAERREVELTKRRALHALQRELAVEEPHSTVTQFAGVPNRLRSLDLLARLSEELFPMGWTERA